VVREIRGPPGFWGTVSGLGAVGNVIAACGMVPPPVAETGVVGEVCVGGILGNTGIRPSARIGLSLGAGVRGARFDGIGGAVVAVRVIAPGCRKEGRLIMLGVGRGEGVPVAGFAPGGHATATALGGVRAGV